jgi:transcriptional regulator with XRE-family HTH domain
MPGRDLLTYNKEVIESPRVWTFWDYVSPGGNNMIEEWRVRDLSDEGKLMFSKLLKNIRNTENHLNWIGLKRFIKRNRDRVWELEFFADGRQYRVLGDFAGEKRAVLLIGCYHKQKVYTPSDALDQAFKRSQLIEKLKNWKYREAYIRASLNVNLPSQIRALRLRQEMTQGDLAEKSKMLQPRISAMEKPGATKFNIETLIRVAAAFEVGLIVRFAPFSEMLAWENGFSQDTFQVPTINSDTEFVESSREPEGLGRDVVSELLGGTFNSPRGSGIGDVSIAQNSPGGSHIYETLSGNTGQGAWVYRDL